MFQRRIRSIGVTVALLLAGVGAHLTASPATAAPPVKGWTCSASTLQANVLPILGGGLPVGLTAGSDNEACADRQAGLDLDLGLLRVLGIGVGALEGTTTNQPAWGPSEQHPVAQTELAGIDISLLSLASIVKVGAVRSHAEAQCVNGSVLASSSYSVADVSVGGTQIADLTEPVELVAVGTSLIGTIVRLTPGEVTDVGGVRTIRALRIVVIQRTLILDTTVADLTLGQSRVSTAGSPCADPTPPSVGAPTVSGRTITATVAAPPGGTLDGCSFTVTRTGGTAQTVAGSVVGSTCRGDLLPATTFPWGGYDGTASAVTRQGGTGTGPSAAFALAGPTVGAPELNGLDLAVPVTPGAGATVTACAMTYAPVGGSATPLPPAAYDSEDGRCHAELPSGLAVGDYEIATTVSDSFGDSADGTGVVTLGGPTVGVPVVSGRTVTAGVTASGSDVDSCEFVGTRSGGAPVTVPGALTAEGCVAGLPRSTFPPGDYVLVARATDDLGRTGSRAGAATLAGPSAAAPTLTKRQLRTAVTPGVTATVVDCSIIVRPDPNGLPQALSATYDASTQSCIAAMPTNLQPGGYAVTTTVTDSYGDEGTSQGPVTLAAPAVGVPTIARRVARATVTPATGTSIAGCRFVLTPTPSGTPIDVAGSYAPGVCSAPLPSSTVPAGDYTVDAYATDDQDVSTTNRGSGTVHAGPSVGPPTASGPDVAVPVAPGPGATVASCTLTITPAAGGTPITVTGTYQDGACVATLPADRFPTGDYDVTTTVTDSYGDTASGSGRVRITQPVVPEEPKQPDPPKQPEAPKPPEAPKAPEAPRNVTEQAPLICDKRQMTLLDVVRQGRSVRISGATVARHQGKTVAIRFLGTGKVVARVRVGDDGLFAARVRAPAKRYLRNSSSSRYRAEIGKARSVPMRLLRRMSIGTVKRSGGKMTFSGTVQRPLSPTNRTVTIRQRLDCSHTRVLARGKVRSNGRFSVTFRHRDARVAGVYRAEAMVPSSPGARKLNRTFTLPRFVPGS